MRLGASVHEVNKRELVDALRDRVVWHQRGDLWYPEYSHWWRDPELLAALGPALAHLFEDAEPSVVVGVEAHGMLLGPLAATALEVGFAIVRKGVQPDDAEDPLLRRTTPPDYKNRGLDLSLRSSLLTRHDRALFVDDWVDTGAQGTAVKALVEDAGAVWVGVAAAIDASQSDVRRRLRVRSLLHEGGLTG